MTNQTRRILVTRREMQIAKLVAAGLTNAAIASELGITEHTVRHTLASVFRKARVSNRVGLALLVFRDEVEESPR
jgi:DNA-binding CsgD family transcriptional regulator